LKLNLSSKKDQKNLRAPNNDAIAATLLSKLSSEMCLSPHDLELPTMNVAKSMVKVVMEKINRN